MKNLLQQLVSIPGPSGYEREIRAAVRAIVEPLADEVRVDAMGNLLARLGPAGQDPDGGPKERGAARKRASKVSEAKGLRILLAAHIDEIGVIATHLDDHGYVRFLPVGGVHPRTCLGGRVRFLNGAEGVIGVERLASVDRMPGFENLFIDLGASGKNECPVKVGDMAVFERPFLDLGRRVVSKALDDRVGVLVMIETLRRLRQEEAPGPHTLWFVFSVQEEVGSRGAATAAFGLEPDLGVAVDVTGSGDTPNGAKMAVSLGQGPAIKVRDQGMLADPRVIDWMARRAQAARLPHQMEILERGTTDAQAIQLSRAGVPAGCLSIPARYIHSPSEMADMEDVENAVRLLTVMLNQPVDGQLADGLDLVRTG